MSYFSHHPEAWDTIEIKGVARALASMHPANTEGWSEMDFLEDMETILAEIQVPTNKRDRKLWSALTEWAQDSISSEEQAYWDSFVP